MFAVLPINSRLSVTHGLYKLTREHMYFRSLGGLCHCLNNTLFSGPRVPVWTWIPGPLPGPPINNENYLQPPSDSCDPKIQYFFSSYGSRILGAASLLKRGLRSGENCCSCSLKERKKTTFDPRE